MLKPFIPNKCNDNVEKQPQLLVSNDGYFVIEGVVYEVESVGENCFNIASIRDPERKITLQLKEDIFNEIKNIFEPFLPKS